MDGRTYEVEWVSTNGARLITPPIPYDSIAVDEREAWLRRIFSTRGGGFRGGSGGAGGWEQHASDYPASAFPDFLPILD